MHHAISVIKHEAQFFSVPGVAMCPGQAFAFGTTLMFCFFCIKPARRGGVKEEKNLFTPRRTATTWGVLKA
jgi:hypothetical protein